MGDRILSTDKPKSQPKITVEPEIKSQLAVMYPVNGNSISDYLSKYSVWNWEVKEVNEPNLQNFGVLGLGLSNEQLHDYRDKAKYKFGHFITGTMLTVFGFVVLKNRVVNAKPGGLNRNKQLADIFDTKLTKIFKKMISFVLRNVQLFIL